MAVRWSVVIRGTNKPWESDLISKIELGSGSMVPIPTWAFTLKVIKKKTNTNFLKDKRGIEIFIF